MTTISGPPASAIRNKPISPELEAVLRAAADAADIDHLRIVSGGQDALGEGTRRTGSTRHDRGRAADLQCLVAGKVLSFTNQSADPAIIEFVTAAAAAGAIGIGAATDYMGPTTIHVGFGTSAADSRKLTWGKDGRSVNAPKWLREAAEAGWAAPAGTSVALSAEVGKALPFQVTARTGLNLRGGPGTEYDVLRTLELGSLLTVTGHDDARPDWVRVDLEGDGLADGFVHSGFIAPANRPGSSESAPEPQD